jgi:ribose transport system ATP-binding protein
VKEYRMKNDFILKMKNIVKRYPGVMALGGVDFMVRRGTVHCLVGENGAGKSTLIKILTCAEKRTSGEIELDGEVFTAKSVKDAMNAGISTVFQEMNIIDQLSVEDNLTLGRENHVCGVVMKNADDPVLRVMREFAPDIDLESPVGSLSLAEKQIVETVRAIGSDAKIVIMDEPTASLSEAETLRIYSFVKQLRAKGITVIYISHLLDDIFELGDEVTVLRDGQIIGTRRVEETSRQDLIRMMIGKSVISRYQNDGRMPGAPLMEVDGITAQGVNNLSFTLHEREIIGFYGLRGAGKSEIARALFGLSPWQAGRMRVNQKEVQIKSPAQAIAEGIAMVPEERMTEGLLMQLSITDNITIAGLKRDARYGVVNEQAGSEIANDYVKRLNIRVNDIGRQVMTLSGGNQQKVVISKYLNINARVLLLDEPTRGVDVGSKAEIYSIIRDLASTGAGIVVFSSEYEEIASLCDRVLVLSEGSVLAEMSQENLDAEKVRYLTMGKRAQ